ncbi:SGNH/GDSL hydrolase family protein [Streptomyces sp. NPDC089919]|uniref:SGNH/GDSL hydrolase family protein n=1 Tax=Streptomyces sp. NPDC089919 TaxID=3155188 RepID=UPI003416974E
MVNDITSAHPAPVPPRRRGRRTAALLSVVVLAGAALAACGDADGKDNGTVAADDTPATPGKKVLWLGDSIAGAEAPPLEAALKASGQEFKNASSDGGGTVVEGNEIAADLARMTWPEITKDLRAFRPDVIAYQITTYDWGTKEQQRTSYEKLAKAAADGGAALVIVSAPPFKADDGPYAKFGSTLATAAGAAEEVAARSGGKVRFLDAGALWGTDHRAARAQRSADGIHSCQQGSAAFAKWFTAELGKAYGFAPAPADEWATGAWTGDARYGKLGCK